MPNILCEQNILCMVGHIFGTRVPNEVQNKNYGIMLRVTGRLYEFNILCYRYVSVQYAF
jgi:hypothetical protein